MWIAMSERPPEPNSEVKAWVIDCVDGKPMKCVGNGYELIVRYKWAKAHRGLVDWREIWTHEELDSDSFLITHWAPLDTPPEGE